MQPEDSLLRQHLWQPAIQFLSLCMALSLPVTGWAVNDMGFGGIFNATETADMVAQKQVHLTMRVYNYSGVNIAGAVIVLEDPLQTGIPLGSIPGVTIPDQGNALVSTDQVVPAEEFLRWQAGVPIRLHIEYSDAAGVQIQQPIMLAPMMPGVQP